MKILKKKIVTCMLLIGFLACACFGLMISNVSADPVEPAEPTATEFSTIEGVWIRENEPTGIRYGASINAAYYNSLVDYYGEVELGMAIARRDNISTLKTEALATLNDADDTNDASILKAKDENSWDLNKNPNLDTSDYEYYFTIKELNTANYNVNYTALAYAKVNDGTTTKIIWSNVASESDTATTRTAAQAAATYLATDGDDDKTFAKAIINQVVADGATLAFNQSTYSLDADSNIIPTVTLDGKEVKAIFSSTNTEKVEFDADGKLIGKGKCESVIINAQIAGTSVIATATVSVSALKAEVSIDKQNGILTLGTDSENTTITVLDGETPVTAKYDVTAATYDIYDAIIKARVEAGTTEAKSYTVKVESENYIGEVTTSNIVAVTDQASLRTVANNTEADSANIYAYLANSITLDGTGLDVIFNQPFMISNSTDTVAGDGKQVFLNLDGRGYAISATVGQAGGNYGIMIFQYLKNSNIKNVMFDYAVTATSSVGMLAYNVTNTKFENCYFKFVSNVSGAVSSIASTISTSSFDNCIFELVDANTDDAHEIVIATGDVPASSISNSVIISNTANESDYLTKLFQTDKPAVCTNVKVFDKVATLVSNADNYADLGSAWSFEATYIKLLGQNVRKTTQENKETTISKAGVMELSTQGALTDVKLYAENGTTLLTTLASGLNGQTTFDVYNAIIAYRESASITESQKYVVKAESEDIVATATTAQISAITDKTSFDTAMKQAGDATTAAANYYYLTTNITLSHSSNTAFGENYIIVGGQYNRYQRINLDGRGHSISYNNGGADAYFMMFYDLEDSSFKNVKFEFDIVGSSGHCILSHYIKNTTFTNCYFDVTTNISKDTALFRGDESGGVAGVFEKCIFEINNSSTYKMGLSQESGAERMIVNDSVIIHSTINTMDDLNVGGKPKATNCKFVSSIATMLTNNATDQSTYSMLGNGWVLTGTEIKLCDITVASAS